MVNKRLTKRIYAKAELVALGAALGLALGHTHVAGCFSARAVPRKNADRA
jgi:hypothetical protein